MANQDDQELQDQIPEDLSLEEQPEQPREKNEGKSRLEKADELSGGKISEEKERLKERAKEKVFGKKEVPRQPEVPQAGEKTAEEAGRTGKLLVGPKPGAPPVGGGVVGTGATGAAAGGATGATAAGAGTAAGATAATTAASAGGTLAAEGGTAAAAAGLAPETAGASLAVGAGAMATGRAIKAVKKGTKTIKEATGGVVEIDPTAELREKAVKKGIKATPKVIILIILIPLLLLLAAGGAIASIFGFRASQTTDQNSKADAAIIQETRDYISKNRLSFTDSNSTEALKSGEAFRPTLKIINFLTSKHSKLVVTGVNEGMGFSVDSVDSIKCVSSTGEKLPEIPIYLDYNYNWASKITASNPENFDCAVGYYPNSDPVAKGQYSDMFGPGIFKLSDLPKKGLSAAQEKIAEIVAQTISINNELNIALTSDDNLLPQEIVVDQSYMIQNIAKDDNNTLALVLKPNITAAYKDLPENTDSFASKANPTAALTINFLK